MIISLNLADGVNYVPLPVSAKVRSVYVSPQADPGAAGSVTVAHWTDDVNVADVAGGSAGDIAVGSADATNGNLTFVAGTDVVKITCSSTNGVAFGCSLDLDEYLVL